MPTNACPANLKLEQLAREISFSYASMNLLNPPSPLCFCASVLSPEVTRVIRATYSGPTPRGRWDRRRLSGQSHYDKWQDSISRVRPGRSPVSRGMKGYQHAEFDGRRRRKF